MAVLPRLSVAVQVTVLLPTGNVLPEAGDAVHRHRAVDEVQAVGCV